MAESIATRAAALADQLDEHVRYLRSIGSTDAAARASERAREARDIAAMAEGAERRLGGCGGPSSATMAPPPGGST